MQQELTVSKPIPVCDTAINAWLDANDKYCTSPPQAMKKEESKQYFPSAFFQSKNPTIFVIHVPYTILNLF